MPGIAHVQNTYAVPPARLWASVTDLGQLAQVCRGMVSFEGLPEGRITSGQVIEPRIRLFGLLPAQAYRMEIIEVDEAAMRVESHERGAAVRDWRHTITVEEVPGGARLTDHVEIEAGWLTPVVTLWARWLYRHRHRRRSALFAAEEAQSD